MPLCQDHGAGKFPALLFKKCMINDEEQVLDLVMGLSYNIYGVKCGEGNGEYGIRKTWKY